MENTLRGVPPWPDGSHNTLRFQRGRDGKSKHLAHHDTSDDKKASKCRNFEGARAAKTGYSESHVYCQWWPLGINNGYSKNRKKEIIKEIDFEREESKN